MSNIQWVAILDREAEGYGEDDSIRFYGDERVRSDENDYYLRVNDMTDGYTWTLLSNGVVIDESIERHKRPIDAMKACEDALDDYKRQLIIDELTQGGTHGASDGSD